MKIDDIFARVFVVLSLENGLGGLLVGPLCPLGKIVGYLGVVVGLGAPFLPVVLGGALPFQARFLLEFEGLVPIRLGLSAGRTCPRYTS